MYLWQKWTDEGETVKNESGSRDIRGNGWEDLPGSDAQVEESVATATRYARHKSGLHRGVAKWKLKYSVYDLQQHVKE